MRPPPARSFPAVWAVCLALVAQGVWLSPAAAAAVQEIRIGEPEPGITRIVFDLSAPAAYQPPFLLVGPNRLVVDVSAGMENLEKVEPRGAVERIRVGRRAGGISRFVFDLPAHARLHGHDALPPAAGRPDRIFVDLIVREPEVPADPAVHTIIVDAGHGGKDPGAVRGTLLEKDLTLAAALELRQILRSRGYRVRLTRETDEYISLRERREKARDTGGDLFISLHADAVKRPGTRGLSAYTHHPEASDRLAEYLARHADQGDAVMNTAVAGWNSYNEQEKNVLTDMTHTGVHNNAPIQFVGPLVASLEEHGIRLLQNPHRKANFFVLKGFVIPAVLIEMGFISNAEDAKLLASSSYRTRLMTAIADFVDQYISAPPQY